jgi:8-oxo-dGTP diphosphatase
MVTRVAVGVLIRDDGRVLLADRPAGKPYAGYWEFPGGKIEPGEAVDAALQRELHEELGIDIGPSVPWVTFEFDYPHAYVELQFRTVRGWRGAPHPREGQRLDFFDPAGDLPQPLLPAAVPALRWLLLPRRVLVGGRPESSPLLADAAASSPQEWRGAQPILVIDADWRAASARAAFDLPHAQLTGRRPAILVSGPGAARIATADGAVLDAGDLDEAGPAGTRLRGAWVDSDEELRLAAAAGCDFALVRSTALATKLQRHAASLPAYLPIDGAADGETDSAQWPGQGRWIDLRPPPGRPTG